MKKPITMFGPCFVNDIYSDYVYSKPFFNSNPHLNDKRLPHLLVLLHQLDQSMRGLDALPELELSEIVACAIQLCGFVDPAECREVIATVLTALEMRDPIPDRSPYWAEPGPAS